MHNGKVAHSGSPEEVIASGAFGDELNKSRPGSKGTSQTHTRNASTVELNENTNGDAGGHAQQNGHTKDPAKDVELAKAKSKEANANTRTESKATGSVSIKVIRMYLASMGPWHYWLFAFFAFALQQVGSVAANVWIRTWANAYTRDVRLSSIAAVNVPALPSHNIQGASYSINSFSASGIFWNLPFTTATSSASSPPMSTSSTSNTQDPKVDAWYYLVIYALLGVFYILISALREGYIFWGSLRASKKLHRELLTAITHAKLQFFDTTPLGQLMNRFSKDVEAIDQDVSPVAVGVLGCLASLISIIVLIVVITPGFLIAGLFISVIYWAIGFFYINSSRDLKRLESIQRSPIYQQFGETLSGAVTIRAYGDERRFIRDNQHRVDTHNRPFIYLWATNRWLALRADFTGALVAFFAGVFVILSIDTIDAGSAGLSLTYAVMFTENVLWLVRLYAANEQNMNSVERIKEYIEVDQEAQGIIEDNRPPIGWPNKGAIEFINYSTRYRPDLDPVLRDLSFSIQPGERVGIVGRTGAGKSSLTLAIFRGLEAYEGKILLDNIDIGTIGLQDLRSAITIVPQDPTLFTGTIRSNLDPFTLFTDAEIFATLRRVQLISSPAASSSSTTTPAPPIPTIVQPDNAANDLTRIPTNTNPYGENTNIFQHLTSPIAESGSNLSQGQRQLLCLARALLKAPKVLIMDEATASIDYATDAKIQDTLREVKESTIVTIAHRLMTIIDYDKVLVLEGGRVVEWGAPWELIGKEGGGFRGMCEMSGDLDALVEAAGRAKEGKTLIDV